MGEINMKLLDNGLDFILKSLESLDTINSDDLKYTALHLYSGVLLIMKERLILDDWKLIFQNLNKANEQSLKNGDFNSVNFKTLLTRLETEGIEIEHEFEESLKWLSSERNKIEHFEVTIKVEVLKSRIVKLLTHVIPFLKNELIANNLLDEKDFRFLEIIGLLHSFEDYISTKLEVLKNKDLSEKFNDYIDCPRCSQRTLVLDILNEAVCYFCETLYSDFPREYINHNYNLYSIISDGGEDPRKECVSCGFQSMIYLNDFEKFICLSCGESFEENLVKTCEHCHVTPVVDYNDGKDAVFCEYCLDYFRGT